MQSRRVWLPEIVAVMAFSEVATLPHCALADPDGADVLDPDIDTVVIGPEGGFAADELAALPRRVSLSRNVLRVETAALASVIMMTLRKEAD
jgi:RsmE family RNA methyltransferase